MLSKILPGWRAKRPINREGSGDHWTLQDALAKAAECTQGGRLDESLRVLDAALELNPGSGSLLFARGSILFSWGRFREAYASLEEAARLEPGGEVYTKFGWTCFWLGRIDEAAAYMQRAEAARPDDWATHFGLATVLRAQSRGAASRTSFLRALELNPGSPNILSSLIAAEIDLGHLDDAERHAHAAVALNDRSASAWSDLGMVLCEQDRHAAAIAAFEHSETLDAPPDEASDQAVNFAICLLRAGEANRARELLERKLVLHPRSTLHSQYALALLTTSRMHDGWDQYEFRWMDPPLLASRPKFPKPVWAGQDLRGKTILLMSEQGFGDFIQFIRYARHIKALGATVLLYVRPEIRDLAGQLPEIDTVVGPNEHCAPFDFYINLLSVPRLFYTELSSVPAEVPYLNLDPRRTAKWAGRFGEPGKLKVGLVWAGSPTHARNRFRTLSLRQLAPWGNVSGLRFYSLQKGPAAREIADASALKIVDLGDELKDFSDTAAAIDQLDLIIGVDTSVIHLAGALAKPVWTLLPQPADWRWLEQREDTPWYPTMRLFRQAGHGDWSEVISRIESALENEVHRFNAGSRAGSLRSSRVLQGLSSKSGPRLPPIEGSSRVAEARAGILQFFPCQPRIGKSIDWYGEFLQAHVELISQCMKPGSTLLEVGAGIGHHALLLAALVGDAGHVFLCEDDDRYRGVLQQNLKSNAVSNFTLLKRPLTRILRSTSSKTDAPAAGSGVRRPVDSVDALQLVALHWLKVNAGCDAAEVINGATETIWRLRPNLFVDGSDDRQIRLLAERLRDLGYACWRLDTPLFSPQNFNGRDTDIFSGEHALAVVAFPEEVDTDISASGCTRLR